MSRVRALYVAVVVVLIGVIAFRREWAMLATLAGMGIVVGDMMVRRLRTPPGQAGRYAQMWLTSNGDDKTVIAERARTEPRPATVGSGQNSLVVMYWNRWGKSIWAHYGASLLGRERTMDAWAEERDYSVLRPAAPDVLTGANAVPALFADETRPSVIYARNKVGIEREGRRAFIVDANRYLLPTTDKTDSLVLVPSTAVICSFRDNPSFVIAEKGAAQRDLWLSFTGAKMLTGDRRFDARYEVYAQVPEAAARVLTEDILEEVSLWDSLRIVSDRGVLVVAQVGIWTEPKNLDALVALAYEIAASGQQANPP